MSGGWAARGRRQHDEGCSISVELAVAVLGVCMLIGGEVAGMAAWCKRRWQWGWVGCGRCEAGAVALWKCPAAVAWSLWDGCASAGRKGRA